MSCIRLALGLRHGCRGLTRFPPLMLLFRLKLLKLLMLTSL